jgi:hypothetical protein
MCTCRYLSDDTDVCFLDMLIGGSQMAEAGDVGRPCSSRTWEMLLERSLSWPVAFSEVESLVAPWTRLTTWPSHQQYQKIRGDTDLYVRHDLEDRISHLQALEKDACSRAKEGLGRMPRLKARGSRLEVDAMVIGQVRRPLGFLQVVRCQPIRSLDTGCSTPAFGA